MRYVSSMSFRYVIIVVDQNTYNFQDQDFYAFGPNLDNGSLVGHWAQYSFTYA
jgi:hypothetical protein